MTDVNNDFLAGLDTDLGETEEKDVLGGNKKFTVPSGVYPATIDVAYFDVSKSSKAKSLTIVYHVEEEGKDEPTEVRHQVWYTNGQGGTKYKDKKTGDERYLPGFVELNNLAQMTTNKELKDLSTRVAHVELWDSEAKKRLPQEKHTLPELVGKKVQLGIKEIRTNKSKYNKDTKETTLLAEERIYNEVSKTFCKDGRTVSEVRTGKTEAEFKEKWIEKYAGKLVDDYDDTVTESEGTSGAPGSTSSTPSLF